MTSLLKECTIVPKNLYVERDSDRQIRDVIANMERPGYVMVARQMGKTNLLMHTKDVLEDDKNIYAYIDLTSVFCNTEAECFDEIIDIIIDTNLDVFQEAFILIEQRRNGRPFTTQREFTRDLRLLLSRVDRLVIILDEIDALTRMPYSDNIFSLIRSHFFQRKNYSELNKLQYILSGVIEPKNIIKNPDISPFNICQKIYVKDFDECQFQTFIEKANIKNNYSEEIFERIYYWTKGHPRLTWDICQLLANYTIKDPADVDHLVRCEYLQVCDRTPIDSIRQQVSSDLELRDAIVQLLYSKADDLSSDVKSQLYLAGITTNEGDSIHFKNPIIRESLPEEWLMSLGGKTDKTKASLDRAQQYIFIDGNYRTALQILTTIRDTDYNPKYSDLLFWLLGEACFRTFDNDSSISYLSKVGSDSPYSARSLFMLGQNYHAKNDNEFAIDYYDKALALDEDTKFKNKIKLAKIEAYLNLSDNIYTSNAIDVINEISEDIEENDKDINLFAPLFYYSALIYEKKGELNAALKYIESALLYAQTDEKPWLTYNKLRLIDQNEKKYVARDLVESLNPISEKPNLQNFDSVITLSSYYLLIILGEIIVNFPQLEKSVEGKLKLFYPRKEDAYYLILTILYQNGHVLSKPMAQKVIELNNNEVWQFGDNQVLTAYSVWQDTAESLTEMEIIGQKLLDVLSNIGKGEIVPIELIRPFNIFLNKVTTGHNYSLLEKAIELSDNCFCNKPQSVIIEEHFIMTSFYKAIVAFRKNNKELFEQVASYYLLHIEEFMLRIEDDTVLDLNRHGLELTIETIYEMGIQFSNRLINLGIKTKTNLFSPNDKIKVWDKIHMVEKVVKYKKAHKLLDSGFYELI